MRTLFVPLAKLLGIYQIFQSLSYTLFVLIRVISRQTVTPGMTVSALVQVISLLLALLLIVKTERIADLLGIPKDKAGAPGLDFDSVLRAGFLLMGAAMLIYAVPALVSAVIGLVLVAAAPDKPGMSQFQNRVYLTELCRPILEIVLGCLLVLKTNRVVSWMQGSRHYHEFSP
jgi:hypothetical protein